MITDEYPPHVGGVGRSVHRIANLMARLGHEIDVVVLNLWRDPMSFTGARILTPSTYTTQQITVHWLGRLTSWDHRPEEELWQDVYEDICTLHETKQYDLFHAFYVSTTGIVAACVAQKVGKPCILSVRGSDVYKDIHDSRYKTNTIWAMEYADVITFVNKDLATKANRIVPCSYKSKVIWNSVDESVFRRNSLLRQTRNNKAEGIVVGSCGIFRPSKGTEILLEAGARLADDLELAILLVGDFKQEYRDSYWQLINKLGLDSRLTVTGFVPHEEVISYLRCMDIFVLPSFYEGAPNSLIEAMVAERPIVAASVGIVPEILRHTEDAIILEDLSTTSLLTAIRRLADNPSFRGYLGKNARKQYENKLTPTIEQSAWQECYDALLQTKKLKRRQRS